MEIRTPVHMDSTWIYDIVMEESFASLKPELEKLRLEERKVCIVTDSNVAPLYAKEVSEIVLSCCKSVYTWVFPAGEENKNLDTVRQLYEVLIRQHFDRHDFLLALGGGVVGDLCGFTAATYLRGISFIQVPTTLLSQVDSSIGGKTGVDFDAYKNMVGAFHMPRLVYANIATFQTLPAEQFSSGMGEVLKHGLIKDASYYQWLMDNQDAILALDQAACVSMVQVSNRIKRDVVEADPTEQGERALLNFGHTLGHAIEKLSDFRLLHGHCVGLGCIAAMDLSEKRGLLPSGATEQFKTVMKSFGMPVTVSGLSKADVIAATKNDKKMEAGTIRFILLDRIGQAYIDKTVTEQEMDSALDSILE